MLQLLTLARAAAVNEGATILVVASAFFASDVMRSDSATLCVLSTNQLGGSINGVQVLSRKLCWRTSS